MIDVCPNPECQGTADDKLAFVQAFLSRDHKRLLEVSYCPKCGWRVADVYVLHFNLVPNKKVKKVKDDGGKKRFVLKGQRREASPFESFLPDSLQG